MRITFLLPRYGWQASGGYRVVYTYASRLARRGHEVYVLHPRRLPAGGWPAPAGGIGRLRRAAGRVRDLLARPGLDWADIDARVRLLYVPRLSPRHVPDADAVIATWWSTAEAAIALPSSKGRAFHLIQGYEIWNGAEERVHAAWRAPLHKIFIAEWLLECAVELGVRAEDATLIPNAIDDVFRLEHPIADRPPNVAMLYSDQVYKGGSIGIDALRHARESVPELTATLFGVSARPRDLPQWMRYVRHATPQQLAADVYGRAAVYLCPSLSEGWHLPPAEAMACGCALVSSDIGGVRDYAVHGDTALLFEPGDSRAAARHIVDVLANEELRTRLAQRGAERIASFSWERSTTMLEDVLAGRPDA